jgi:PAS domain S-box-containing protein
MSERLTHEAVTLRRLGLDSRGVLVVSASGVVRDADARACDSLRYAMADLVGQSLHDLLAADDAAPPGAAALAALLERSAPVERQFRRADGSLIHVEITAARLEDGAVQVVFRDLGDRRVAEAEMRQALSLLTATLDSTMDGILVVDLAGRVELFNRRFAEMWNIPDDVLATRDDSTLINFVLSQLRDPRGFLLRIEELYSQSDAESFDVIEFLDGRVFERSSRPQRLDGLSVGRVWSFRDITERRRTEVALRSSEEQLRQAQKMEAIGQLAGGMAHDFNNILTVIMGFCDLLEDDLEAGSRSAVRVGEIHASAERAAGLTRQLLAYSRKQVLNPIVLDVWQLLRETEHMLRHMIGEDIELDTNIEPGPCHVRADPIQVQQAFLNITANARDAMPHGGRLEIRAARRSAGQVPRRYRLGAVDHVVIEFQDTGVGMDAETRSHVFEPFFTTKGIGKGTGLGLASVYGIVRQSGGAIEVESSPDMGATFRIYLPVSGERPHATRDAITPDHEAPANGETILLVEDEAMVRSFIVQALARGGYRVIEAATGAEALRLARDPGRRIDLLLTDLVMPEMGGQALAAQLHHERPDLKVLYMSGYSQEVVAERVGAGSEIVLLAKPFSAAVLLGRVGQLIAERS